MKRNETQENSGNFNCSTTYCAIDERKAFMFVLFIQNPLFTHIQIIYRRKYILHISEFLFILKGFFFRIIKNFFLNLNPDKVIYYNGTTF